ncbi:MAG: hypothetical protein M3P53_05900, partial [Actinomycetota bacterium]|nr:hypothetical protein [Actinomycetota bacterium]
MGDTVDDRQRRSTEAGADLLGPCRGGHPVVLAANHQHGHSDGSKLGEKRVAHRRPGGSEHPPGPHAEQLTHGKGIEGQGLARGGGQPATPEAERGADRRISGRPS